MLYLVLVLVIAAFALLIAALTTANTLWAWVSVGLSAVAAGLLVFDWLRSRRRVAAASVPRRADEPEPAAGVTIPPPSAERPEGRPAQATEVPAAAEPADTPDIPDALHTVDTADTPAPADTVDTLDTRDPLDTTEPGEEPTDAADLLVISELNVEVRVVDEHPRYHLSRCTWLSGKPTIPLPVSEARQLGFTPCARCGPDAVLAAKHRTGKGAAQ